MKINKLEVTDENQELVATLLEFAGSRVEVPDDWLWLNYDKEGDSLFIKVSDLISVISRSDDDSEIFDYDENDELVGIEILDICGKY